MRAEGAWETSASRQRRQVGELRGWGEKRRSLKKKQVAGEGEPERDRKQRTGEGGGGGEKRRGEGTGEGGQPPRYISHGLGLGVERTHTWRSVLFPSFLSVPGQRWWAEGRRSKRRPKGARYHHQSPLPPLFPEGLSPASPQDQANSRAVFHRVGRVSKPGKHSAWAPRPGNGETREERGRGRETT